MAKNYNKIDLIADHKTGAYTQRELASKYMISKTMVTKVTKGITHENKELVRDIINQENELLFKSDQEVTSIQNIVSKETREFAKFKAQLEILSDKAMQKASDLLDQSSYGADYKAIMDGIDKHSITMGYSERFNKNAGINNINAQQNTSAETLSRVIKNLPD
jgi:hypothetical protein